jgi:hypothetical protein
MSTNASATANGTTYTMASEDSPALTKPSSLTTLSTNIGSSLGTTTDIPLFHALHSIAIKSLVPYTLDMESYNYTKWGTLFSMVLGHFNLLHHIEDDTADPDDIEWTKVDLLVGNWIYSTIYEKLMDMCMRQEHPTSHKIWVHLVNLFTCNKSSHVVHLECELHNLIQGEMSANDFYRRLQQLIN